MSEKKKTKTIAEKIQDNETIRIEFTVKPEDGFLYTELANVNSPTLFAKEAYKMHINNVLTGRILSLHYSNINAVNMINPYMPYMMPQQPIPQMEMIQPQVINEDEQIEDEPQVEDDGVMKSEEINLDEIDDDEF